MLYRLLIDVNTDIFFGLSLHVDKELSAFRGIGKSTVHISPSPAGHTVFNFHVSVSGQFLEPPNREDIFASGAFLQVKPDDSGFLG